MKYLGVELPPPLDGREVLNLVSAACDLRDRLQAVVRSEGEYCQVCRSVGEHTGNCAAAAMERALLAYHRANH